MSFRNTLWKTLKSNLYLHREKVICIAILQMHFIGQDFGVSFCINLNIVNPRDFVFSYYNLVLWLAGGSSWSRPHRKVRRRVTSFWSSGFGIGWVRSRLGVSLGRMRGGWSRKLSKMSKFRKNKQNLKFLYFIAHHSQSRISYLPPPSSVPGGGAQQEGGALAGPSL